MGITFDSVTLDRPKITSIRYPISESEAVLIGGKRDQDTESNHGTEYTIECKGTNRTNLDLLIAKIGTAGTLLFDAVNKGTYRITSLTEVPAADYATYFVYTVNFRRHTA